MKESNVQTTNEIKQQGILLQEKLQKTRKLLNLSKTTAVYKLVGFSLFFGLFSAPNDRYLRTI